MGKPTLRVSTIEVIDIYFIAYGVNSYYAINLLSENSLMASANIETSTKGGYFYCEGVLYMVKCLN